jgi:YD repeat-containing protein
VNYEYYGPTSPPIASGATACGVPASTPQLGMLRRTVQADPDGAGPATPVVREYVYDAAGRQVGYRASTNVAAEPWTCTSFDDAGRVAATVFPAWNGQPARTVTNNYRVGGNPNVTSVTDSAGTITTTADWGGRTVSASDVWGFTTTVAYDDLGRVTSASNPGGEVGFSYNGEDLVTQQRVNGKVVATPTYDSLGRMTAVSYPSGVGNGANGTSGLFGFDDRGLPRSVRWRNAGAGLVTSDEITSRDQLQRVVGRSTDGFDPNGAAANYTYARSGELVSAVGFAVPPAAGAATRTVTYGYAASGGCGVAGTAGRNVNRTSKRVNAGTPVGYCYDHADRLTSTSDPLEPVSVAAGTLAYDSHGNTSRLGDEVHTYDVAGRHVRTGPAPGASGVPTVAYVRDATDVIVSRSADGVVSGRYASTTAGAPSVVLNASNQPISATVGLLGGVNHSYDPTVAAVNGRGITRT